MLSLTNETPLEVLPALAPRWAAGEASAVRGAARFVALEMVRRGALPPDDPAAQAIPACSWAGDEPDPVVRSRAAALCASRAGTDLATLERLARDPDWRVRVRLAAVLASRRDAPETAVVLNVLARDVHSSVRRAASEPALS